MLSGMEDGRLQALQRLLKIQGKERDVKEVLECLWATAVRGGWKMSIESQSG
jgi:hypothetical protein